MNKKTKSIFNVHSLATLLDAVLYCFITTLEIISQSHGSNPVHLGFLKSKLSTRGLKRLRMRLLVPDGMFLVQYSREK